LSCGVEGLFPTATSKCGGCLAKVPAPLPKKTKTVENTYIIVCLYVDYMLILGTDIEVIKSTIRMLSNNFDIKNLGITDVILRIKIIRTPNVISLSQSHCVDKIERFKEHEKGNANYFLSHIQLHKNTRTGKRRWSILKSLEV